VSPFPFENAFISCCSKQAIFDGKKAIRGGIPFVFRKYAYRNLFRAQTCVSKLVKCFSHQKKAYLYFPVPYTLMISIQDLYLPIVVYAEHLKAKHMKRS
jgi:hypothetical protein